MIKVEMGLHQPGAWGRHWCKDNISGSLCYPGQRRFRWRHQYFPEPRSKTFYFTEEEDVQRFIDAGFTNDFKFGLVCPIEVWQEKYYVAHFLETEIGPYNASRSWNKETNQPMAWFRKEDDAMYFKLLWS